MSSGPKFIGWGWNSNHQLSRDNVNMYNENIKKPQKIFNDINFHVNQISTGLTHTLILTEDGIICGIGNANYGRLGFKAEVNSLSTWTSINYTSNSNNINSKKEKKNKLWGELRAISIACGYYSSAAITSHGELYVWGQLIPKEEIFTPKLIQISEKVSKVALGKTHGILLTESNQCYSWGKGESGQLGIGEVDPSFISKDPILIQKDEGLKNRYISDISCSASFSAILATSQVWMFGKNNDGQCGLPHSTKKIWKPTQILKTKPIAQLSLGEVHVACITKSGNLITFGKGNVGQCGTLIFSDSGITDPQIVKGALFGKCCVQVSCGAYHTVVLTDDSEIYSFGLNDHNQIGHSLNDNQSEPYHIRLDSFKDEKFKINFIISGGRHTIAHAPLKPVTTVATSTFSEDFERILKTNSFADVVIVCGKEGEDEIKAHKVFLSKCPKIGNLIEKSKINLAFPKTVVQNILSYLYTSHFDIDLFPSENMALQEYCSTLSKLSDFLGLEELSSYIEKKNLEEKEKKIWIDVPHCKIEMKEIFEKKQFTDVIFEVEGVPISSNKCILVERSPYFKALLQGNFSESSAKQIPIHDIDPIIFSQILEYIYTDNVIFTPDEILELLAICDLFELYRLKNLCEIYTENGVDVENVCGILNVSIMYSASQLEKYCIFFIEAFFNQVQRTDDYKKLDEEIKEKLRHGISPDSEVIVKEEQKNDSWCLLQ